MKCTVYSYGVEIGSENKVVDYDYDDAGNGILQINIKYVYNNEQHERSFFGCGLAMKVEGK